MPRLKQFTLVAALRLFRSLFQVLLGLGRAYEKL